MEPLQHSSQKNPCPVCNGTNAACKSREAFVLCMTEAGSNKFEIVSGWKNIGLSGDWAQFVPSDQQGRDPIEAQKQSQAKEERAALLRAGLSPAERHVAHAQLLAQLSLHSDDRADLERRGLRGETIESFRSIEANQTLDLPINGRTPGVGFGGRKLLTRTAGYLVPARDTEGHILGFQIRNRAGKSPKYPWLSVADVTPANLQNGEMPLTFAKGGDSSTLYFAEGILKPMVAAERLGINVLGASGGLFTSSPRQLEQCISALLAESFVLCPDGGAIANARILRSYSALNDQLANQGRELKVLWWGQTSKSANDIDEISREQFHQASLISWDEFAAMALKLTKKPAAKPTKNSPIATVKKLDKKNQKQAIWLKEMAAIAELPEGSKVNRETINAALMSKQLLPAKHTEGFYEPLELAPANERRMYALDGQKGARKTSIAIKSLVDAAKAVEQTCLVVVPSRLLSRDASRVLGTACHLDGGAESARYLTTCPESLYKFARQQWDVVIFDEVNEDIKRTFDGSLGVNPELCQKMTERILQTASTIAIANDQMLRASIKAAQRMAGISPQEIITVQRKRAASEMTVKLYLDMVGGEDDGEKKDRLPSNNAFYGWLSRLAEAIESGQTPAIPCGSQTKARMIDRGLRAYFKSKLDAQGRRFRGQVLDGPATPTKVKTEFASDPDQWLADHQPHWLIWTPCFNSGVSIESDYFDAQYELISVFENANAASQRGERVRALLDSRIKERHVLISNRGLPACPDSAIFTAQYWRKLSENTVTGRTEPTDWALAKSIGAVDFLIHHRQELLEALSKKPELFEYWAIDARETFFKLETLKAEWQGNGWNIEEGRFLEPECKKWRTLMQQAKQSVIESQSRALAKARAIAAEGRDLSPYAAVRARKHHLSEQVGHDYEQLKDSKWLESWVVAPDNSGGISSQRVNTLVKMSSEAPDLWSAICHLDTMRAIASGTEIENLPSLPIPAKEIATAKILIDCPGLIEVLFGKLTKWSKSLPIVSKAANYLRENAERLATLSKHTQRILGLQFKDSTPIINCFHKALQMAGAEAQTIGQAKKIWQYRLKDEADCQKKIGQKDKQNEPVTPSDLRDLLRFRTIEELQQQLTSQLKSTVEIAAERWQAVAQQIAQMTGGECPHLMPPSITEERAEEAMKRIQDLPSVDILMTQLTWCQGAQEYERIRGDLEQHGLDFDAQCWVKIPSFSQQAICSFFEQPLLTV